MPIPTETQSTILSNIRELVPDNARNKVDRRHSLVLGAVIALQAIDHNLVPPHWLMNAMAGTTERLFRVSGGEADKGTARAKVGNKATEVL